MPAFYGYNPYSSSSSIDSENEFSGIIEGQYYKDKTSLFQRAKNSFITLFSDEPEKKGYNLTLNYGDMMEGDNNKFMTKVRYDFGMINFHTAKLEMTDANSDRWTVPKDIISNGGDFDFKLRMEMLGFQHNKNGEQFHFSFARFDNKSDLYLTTEGESLVFFDKYIQMDMRLPNMNLFGLGERNREFNISSGAWSMWAKGAPVNQTVSYDDGSSGLQTYSVHPFLIAQSSRKGDFIGIFFRNTNSQSPVVYQNTDNTTTLSYITTGGKIETYFFIHNSVKGIVQDYMNIIGKPQLPPFWSFGW